MSARAFKIALALLAVLVLLSSTTFLGTMLGFFFGIAVAFFIAPLTFLLEAIARAAGTPIAFHRIVYGLAALYGLAVLFAACQAYRASAQSDAAAFRLTAMRAILLAALPLVAWLSSRALIRAWP